MSGLKAAGGGSLLYWPALSCWELAEELMSLFLSIISILVCYNFIFLTRRGVHYVE